MNCFALMGTSTPPAPSTTSQSLIEAGRQIDTRQIDFHAGPARGQVGRNRRNKFVNFFERAIGADAGEAHHRHAIGAFERAGLNRLPVHRIERGAEQRRERGLAHAGVGSGNKKVMPHAEPANARGMG